MLSADKLFMDTLVAVILFVDMLSADKLSTETLNMDTLVAVILFIDTLFIDTLFAVILSIDALSADKLVMDALLIAAFVDTFNDEKLFVPFHTLLDVDKLFMAVVT